ncbi:MAG: metal ABC transporter substrate-binding protein [Candidatus Promineifilaceae bacterium]
MNKEKLSNIRIPIIVLAFTAIAVGCGEQTATEGDQDGGVSGNLINVVATTTILGDVVGAVGGELIDLDVLLPPGADPHAYLVTPRDVAALADADLVFVNGLGLETFLEPVLENVGANTRVITVSDGIKAIRAPGSDGDENTADADPHVWFDPLRVMIWVDNIEDALIEMDPDNQNTFRDNAELYREQLRQLDAWIVERIEQLPVERRLLVTDHDSFGYLVDRYGLELIGTVIPGYSTQSQPSAKELAALLEIIGQRDVTAVFVSDSANSSLAEQIARDSEIRLIPLSTGSLTVATGEAATYLEFMHTIIETITDALSAAN